MFDAPGYDLLVHWMGQRKANPNHAMIRRVLIFDQVSLEKITWEEAPLPFRLHLKPSHLKIKVDVPIKCKVGAKSLFRRNTDSVWLTMEEL